MAAPHPLLLPLIAGVPIAPGDAIDDAVAASATEHHVGALVEQAIEDRRLAVSDSARRHLTRDRMRTEAEHRASITATSRVVEAAEGLGIRVAVFKGIPWACRWYDSPELRPAIDVDIAIHPDDLGRIGELVEAIGGRPDDAAIATALAATDRVFELTVPVGASSVDVHRDPANLLVPIRQVDELWPPHQRSYALTPAGAVETFDDEWSLLIGLIHGMRDNFADLLHLNDLRLMIAAEPQWRRLEVLADGEGWTDIIRYAVAFVSDTLGIESPLPRRIRRSAKLLFEAVWPRELLLQGADSIVRSHQRQSALSALIRQRAGDVTVASLARMLPPRQVIDRRSGLVDSAPYALALIRWRASQRRSLVAQRDAVADGPEGD